MDGDYGRSTDTNGDYGRSMDMNGEYSRGMDMNGDCGQMSESNQDYGRRSESKQDYGRRSESGDYGRRGESGDLSGRDNHRQAYDNHAYSHALTPQYDTVTQSQGRGQAMSDGPPPSYGQVDLAQVELEEESAI
jgi:hypothetical protein